MAGQSPLEQTLHRISQATRADLARFKEGVHHSTSTSRSIEDLQHQAIADRLRLGDTFRATGSGLLRKRPAENRAAVGRFYYAMYHYMRAVVFFVTSGDDHEAHSTLPKHVPADFPNQSTWQNDLRGARLSRNEADYDAYPSVDADFRASAQDLEKLAKTLSNEVRTYLRGKGCAHV